MRVADINLPFEPKEHDLRLHLGEWVSFVRAVRRGESLSGGGGSDLEVMVILLVVLAAVRSTVQRWQQVQPWKVGVVRLRADRWGATGGARVIHQEWVRGRDVPSWRLEELAAKVRTGELGGP